MLERILMTTDAVGGVWTHSLQLCRRFAAQGIDVLLAVMGPGLTEQKWREADAIHRLAVAYRPFALEWMQDAWDDVREAGEWLCALEEEWQPQICHVNGYVHAAYPFRAPTLLDAHACVYSWWCAVHGASPGDEWQRYREAVRDGLRLAGAVVASTHWMCEQLATHYGANRPISIIPTAREAALFQPAQKEKIVVATGRGWDAKKTLTALDTAAGLVTWPLMVAGAQPREHVGARRFMHCELLGEMPSIAAWLARASIFVSPAKYDPLGLSVLEAALCECALVLGDTPSLREVWGDAALYVDPVNPVELADAIRSLVEAPKRRADLAHAARVRALGRSPDMQAQRYLDLYRALLSGRRAPSFPAPSPPA